MTGGLDRRSRARGSAVRPPAPRRPGSIGIMGGTFDPIHIGHLAIADEAREVLGLERILFVPAARPPHRPEGSATDVEARAAMVELAIADNPSFELSRIEIERSGPSYTVDTVEAIAAAERRAGRRLDLVFILSAETLRDLPTWRSPERLLDAACIAVVPREGYPVPSAAWLRERFPGRTERIDVLAGPRLGLSSTSIRARVAAGRSIRYLVPPAVERYIEDHHLYASPTSPATRRTTSP